MNINELYGLKRNERYKALEALSDSELKTLAKKLFNELFPHSNLNNKIDSDDRENLIESIVKITSASSKGITQTQKYDPFAITNETHCGDCNKLLSKNGRIEEAYFQEGVRCKQCHELFLKHKNELKILIGELNDIIKTQPLNASKRLRYISQHLIRIANELDMPETVKIFTNMQEKETPIEKIAREFDIPLEEAKKRADKFFSGLPKEPLSKEVQNLKEKAMKELKRKG